MIEEKNFKFSRERRVKRKVCNNVEKIVIWVKFSMPFATNPICSIFISFSLAHSHKPCTCKVNKWMKFFFSQPSTAWRNYIMMLKHFSLRFPQEWHWKLKCLFYHYKRTISLPTNCWAFFGWQVSANHQLAFLKRVWGKEKISPSSWKKNCGKRRVYSINYYYHSAVFHLNIPLKALLILISQFVAWMKYFTCIFPLPFTRCC